MPYKDTFEIVTPAKSRIRVTGTIESLLLREEEALMIPFGDLLVVVKDGLRMTQALASKGKQWDLLDELAYAHRARLPEVNQTELQTFIARRVAARRLYPEFEEVKEEQKTLLKHGGHFYYLRTHCVPGDSEIMLSNADWMDRKVQQRGLGVGVLGYRGTKDDGTLRYVRELLLGSQLQRDLKRYICPTYFALYYFPRGTALENLPELGHKGQGWDRGDDTRRKSAQYTLKLDKPSPYRVLTYTYRSWARVDSPPVFPPKNREKCTA